MPKISRGIELDDLDAQRMGALDDDCGVRAPDPGDIEGETRRVADTEHAPAGKRRLGHQKLGKATPRGVGLAAEAVD
jgi:hypothetical protein